MDTLTSQNAIMVLKVSKTSFGTIILSQKILTGNKSICYE